MYRKKYGKMTFSAWLNAELESGSLAALIVGGVLMGVGCILVRIMGESPYRMMLQLGISDLIPPVWFFSLLRFLSLVSIGCAAGLVLSWRACSCPVEKYRGCLWFLLMAVLELLWYPTLFSAGLVFVWLLETMLMLLLSVLVTVNFLRVSRFSGILMLLHNVWLIYLLTLAVSVFLRN